MNLNIHSGCALRVFITNYKKSQPLHVVFFGADPDVCTKEELDYLSQVNTSLSPLIKIEVLWQTDIEKDPVGHFSRLLQPADEHQYLGLVFNLESLNVCFDDQCSSFPGTCRSNFSSPLKSSHAIQIASLLGSLGSLVFFSISGFNPSVEDYTSGHVVALMIYYFSLEYAKSRINI